MSYGSSFTGKSADDSRAEADRILKIIEDVIGDDTDRLTPTQQKFIEQMAEDGPVSGKQLLWLRDIKDGLI